MHSSRLMSQLKDQRIVSLRFLAHRDKFNWLNICYSKGKENHYFYSFHLIIFICRFVEFKNKTPPKKCVSFLVLGTLAFFFFFRLNIWKSNVDWFILVKSTIHRINPTKIPSHSLYGRLVILLFGY